jgi:tRNA(fMet)-specific endonuclease VapC
MPGERGSEVFVLDTNTVLDYFKGRGRVAEHLLAVAPSEIGLPAISVYEVWVGVLGSQNPKRRREQFEAFLSVVEILPFEAEAGMRAAELRHKLERAGEAIGPLDTLIAATALAHGGILVTRNLREFARVPGLKAVNWHD